MATIHSQPPREAWLSPGPRREQPRDRHRAENSHQRLAWSLGSVVMLLQGGGEALGSATWKALGNLRLGAAVMIVPIASS